jgi:hypothetical protein
VRRFTESRQRALLVEFNEEMMMTIAKRIVILISLVVLVVSLSLGILAITIATGVVKRDAEASMLSQAEISAALVAETIRARLDVLQELANLPAVRSMDFETQKAALLISRSIVKPIIVVSRVRGDAGGKQTGRQGKRHAGDGNRRDKQRDERDGHRGRPDQRGGDQGEHDQRGEQREHRRAGSGSGEVQSGIALFRSFGFRTTAA